MLIQLTLYKKYKTKKALIYMSESLKFWKKTTFWENIKRTIAIFAAPGVVGLHELGAADVWLWLASAFSFVGAILAIWVVDSDKNGIVDIFQ